MQITLTQTLMIQWLTKRTTSQEELLWVPLTMYRQKCFKTTCSRLSLTCGHLASFSIKCWQEKFHFLETMITQLSRPFLIMILYSLSIYHQKRRVWSTNCSQSTPANDWVRDALLLVSKAIASSETLTSRIFVQYSQKATLQSTMKSRTKVSLPTLTQNTINLPKSMELIQESQNQRRLRHWSPGKPADPRSRTWR